MKVRADALLRWRSWASLAIIVGLFAGIVASTTTGAQRTDSAYSRLMVSNHAAQYLVDDFIPNPDAAIIRPSEVEALVSLSEADSFRVYAPATNVSFNLVASSDGRAFGSGLNRPKLLAGRLPNPSRTDEALADFTMPGASVGQRVTVPLLSATGVDTHVPDFHARPVPASFTIVGIVAAPTQFPPYPENTYFTGPNYYLTRSFYQAHKSSLAALEFTLISVAPGAGTAASRAVELLGHGRQVAVQDLRAHASETNRSIHWTAVALWILSGLLLLVGISILAQLLSRLTTLEARDNPVLRTIGLTTRQLMVMAILRAALVGAAGAALGVLILIGTSALFPISLARIAEPRPGLIIGPSAVVIVVLGSLAVCATLTAWPAWRTARPVGGRLEASGERVFNSPSSLIAVGANAGLPVSVLIGIRLAFERGSGTSRAPVRSTIGGSVVGIAALVAALTFGSSLNHLLNTRNLYGVTWDTEIWNNNGPRAMPAAIPVVRSESSVIDAAYIQTGIDFVLDGHTVSGFSYQPIKGRFLTSIEKGRAPTATDEIALGSNSAAALAADLGSRLHGNAEIATAPVVPVRVVGIGVLPPGDVSAHLGTGVIATRGALQRMAGGQARSPYVIAVAFRKGIDVAAATARLDRKLKARDGGFFTQAPATPADMVNFGRVQGLPLLLGLLLGVLAVFTTLHLIVTSIRRHHRDVAVLRVMGFTRADIGVAVASQATAVSVAMLVVALPVGLVIGRLVWRMFATNVGVVPVPVIPFRALIVLVPALIVVINLVALVPARSIKKFPPAVALREE